MIDTGDTAWVLVSAALVMFMTPGLALFYGGLVRSKNVLGTIMQSFFALAIVSVLWVLVGYTLAFGKDIGGLIGGLDFFGFSGVGPDPSPDYATTVPHSAFAVYQMMFAVITPALISGAIAERMKFSAYVLFIGLWSILVYAPLAHWVWGGGWLAELGALDFAGGTGVHINAGAATGAVGGLVAITPAAGFVEPMGAIVIGLGAGVICWAAVDLKSRIGYDDSLDVVGVHMVGGMVGALLTGVLASTAVNEFSGGIGQLGTQAVGVGATLEGPVVLPEPEPTMAGKEQA